MRLNPSRFNAHLNKIGQDFLWRRAFACPCRNPQSGAARRDCPQCAGKNWFWASAVPASAGVAGQKTQLQWTQSGQFQAGDVVVSIPEDSPMYEMGQIDRVVMRNSTDQFSTTLMHGQDQLYGAVLTITRVFWLDPASTVVDGAIPAFSPDGHLTWESGAPPTGVQYTVCGTQLSEYFCWGPYTSDRGMHHGARLPRKVILRKFDLFGR